MTTFIETANLSLCRPTPEDALILRGLWRNEKVREFLGGSLLEENITKKITDLQDHWDCYGFGLCAVWQKASQRLVGLCGLHHTQNGLELSYLLFPESWGQGMAREAAQANLYYGFTVLKQQSIIAITQEPNLPSCRLLDAIGMKLIHKLKRFNAQQCFYRMDRNDWALFVTSRKIIPWKSRKYTRSPRP